MVCNAYAYGLILATWVISFASLLVFLNSSCSVEGLADVLGARLLPTINVQFELVSRERYFYLCRWMPGCTGDCVADE